MSNTVVLTAAMRANVVSLQQTQKLQSQTQQRLSTGLKVSSPLDNPANYFAAQGYTQRADQLSSLKDNMGEAIQMINTANNGVTALQSMISNMTGQLNQASAALGTATSATTLSAVASAYNTIVQQMDQLSQIDTNYKGVNFMKGNSVTYTVNFDETASTSLTLTGYFMNTGGNSATLSQISSATLGSSTLSNGTGSGSGNSGLGIYGGNASGSTGVGSLTTSDINSTSGIAAIQKTLNNALSILQSDSSKLSGNLATLQTRQDFTTSMMNTLQDGASNLTVADTNQEGANMLMLQTRQQLGTTALSLASQSAQAVLRLF